MDTVFTIPLKRFAFTGVRFSMAEGKTALPASEATDVMQVLSKASIFGEFFISANNKSSDFFFR